MCKSDIPFGATWYACSVSTCNRARLAMYFCSTACWEAHLPEARHRDAWAEQNSAPSKQQYEQEEQARVEKERRREAAESDDTEARRRIVPQEANDAQLPRDVLVVVSKLKKYVRARSGLNTSDGVTTVLSDHLRELCARAIRVAAEDGRKTVMDRDFAKVLRDLGS